MRRILIPSLVGFGLALSGCMTTGGDDKTASSTSSGGGSTPPPPPAGSPFNTTEFQANWGLDAVGALAAYDDGLTGAGVVVGVIDTGVDLDQADLDDNIHSASRDIYDGGTYTIDTIAGSSTTFSSTRTGGAQLDDQEGHGTFVAGLIAAEKNDSGSHGLAFNAQVLAVRADESGTCPGSCSFDDNALAASINYAVSQSVDVLNISLGGSAANPYLEGALENAVAADTVVVVSAGNAPESVAPYTPTANPDPMALEALEAWANGQIIIAGAAQSDGNIADFSNRAGSAAQYFLLAPGMDLYGPTVNSGTGASTHGIGSGTSFAAPIISAAAALLIENFPSLTAAEVVEILLDSAQDVGATGVDNITGRGLLDLEAALAPMGPTSLILKEGASVPTGGRVDLDQGAGVLGGGAFGDGVALGLSGGSIFLDRYDRAYETDFAGRVHMQPTLSLMEDRLDAHRDYETASLDLGHGVSLTYGVQYEDRLTSYEEDLLGLSERESTELENSRLRLHNQVDERTRFSLGFGGDAEDLLTASAAGRGFDRQRFLSEGTQLPWQETGSGGRQFGAEHRLRNGMSLSFAYGAEDVDVPDAFNLADFGEEASRASMLGRVGYGGARGGIDLTFGQVREEGMVLGSFSAGYLDFGRGADTTYLGLGASHLLSKFGDHDLVVFGQAVGGLTDVASEGGQVFGVFDTLATSQFAAGLSLGKVFVPSGRLSLVVSQPLRLEGGAATLATASGWDYESETAIFDQRPVSLTPSGREIDVELGYRFNLAGADVSANLLWQRQPGHVETADDGFGFMLTSRTRF